MESTQENYYWYALYTRSRAEKKVKLELEAKKVNLFLPMRRTIRQWSDRKKWIDVPLFNSYIFVYICDKQYYEVLNTPGAVKFVSFEGKAVSIPVQQIEAIKAFVGQGAPDYGTEIENLEAGNIIEIQRGPMMGLRGTLLSVAGKHRVRVEIESVGKYIIIDVPKSSLKLITGI